MSERERERERERDVACVERKKERERVSLEDKVWPKKRVKTNKNWKQKMPHFLFPKGLFYCIRNELSQSQTNA